MIRIIKNAILSTILLLKITETQALQTMAMNTRTILRPTYTTLLQRNYQTSHQLRNDSVDESDDRPYLDLKIMRDFGSKKWGTVVRREEFQTQLKEMRLADLRFMDVQIAKELQNRRLPDFQVLKDHFDRMQTFYLPIIHENIRDKTLGIRSDEMYQTATDLIKFINPDYFNGSMTEDQVHKLKENIQELSESYKNSLSDFNGRLTFIKKRYNKHADYYLVTSKLGDIYHALNSFEIFSDHLEKCHPLQLSFFHKSDEEKN